MRKNFFFFLSKTFFLALKSEIVNAKKNFFSHDKTFFQKLKPFKKTFFFENQELTACSKKQCQWIYTLTLIEKVHLDDLDVYLATLEMLLYSDHQHWNLQRSLTQLVSTSNKRSSSGEMKKIPEEGTIELG